MEPICTAQATKETAQPTQMAGFLPKRLAKGTVRMLPMMVPTFRNELMSCCGVVWMFQPEADLGSR